MAPRRLKTIDIYRYCQTYGDLKNRHIKEVVKIYNLAKKFIADYNVTDHELIVRQKIRRVIRSKDKAKESWANKYISFEVKDTCNRPTASASTKQPTASASTKQPTASASTKRPATSASTKRPATFDPVPRKRLCDNPCAKTKTIQLKPAFELIESEASKHNVSKESYLREIIFAASKSKDWDFHYSELHDDTHLKLPIPEAVSLIYHGNLSQRQYQLVRNAALKCQANCFPLRSHVDDYKKTLYPPVTVSGDATMVHVDVSTLSFRHFIISELCHYLCFPRIHYHFITNDS